MSTLVGAQIQGVALVLRRFLKFSITLLYPVNVPGFIFYKNIA